MPSSDTLKPSTAKKLPRVKKTKAKADPIPTPGPAHKKLSAFVGRWLVRGEGNKTSGLESYEWFEGDFFLLYRWQRDFNGQRHTGFGSFGFDPKKRAYFAQFFDNLGYARRYDVEVLRDTMRLSGEWERATIDVSEDRRRLEMHWEQNKDGGWSTLCNLRGARLRAAEPSTDIQ